MAYHSKYAIPPVCYMLYMQRATPEKLSTGFIFFRSYQPGVSPERHTTYNDAIYLE